MIQYKSGNLFDSGADCLINPVNCVGVMGKGLALEFKQQFPDMYITYKSLCANNQLVIGKVGFYIDRTNMAAPIICLFPTKSHWQRPSTVEIIDRSLQAFIKYAPGLNVRSVAFPKVGCGLGGLSFDNQVGPLLHQYFTENDAFDVTVYI